VSTPGEIVYYEHPTPRIVLRLAGGTEISKKLSPGEPAAAASRAMLAEVVAFIAAAEKRGA
jgi:hypothetical protein